jgi:hypothetical protein
VTSDRMTWFVALAVAALPVWAGTTAGAQGAPGPHRVTIAPRYRVIPGGLFGLAVRSDLVVIAEAIRQSAGSRTEAIDVYVPTVRTRVKVTEVLKGRSAAGEFLDVEQDAGELALERQVLEVDKDRYAPLVTGAKYALFLCRWPERRVVVPTNGPHSIYMLEDGKVTTQGQSALALGTLDELRRLVRQPNAN